MRAIFAPTQSDSEDVSVATVQRPQPAAGEVLIEIAAIGVNRADLLQARGLYPSPPGWPEWLGLECAGIIAEVGDGVDHLSEGDAVCALVGGGAYAEAIAVPADLTLPVPVGLDVVAAGGLMEAACTVWSNLDAASARAGDTLVVHGGAGGIGSIAIQMAKAMGLTVIATAAGPERAALCRTWGADVGVDYLAADFVTAAKDLGGADVILDVVGGAYLERNLAALAVGGRLVVIGLMKGARAEIDLGALMAKRAHVIGTTLRARPHAERAAIVAAVGHEVWPWVPDLVRPVIHATVPLAEAARAHAMLRSGGVAGKVLLVP